jgi:hypothetical protein
MLDLVAQNPTVSTVIGMLAGTVVAFYTGQVFSGSAVAQIRKDAATREAELKQRIADEEARADRWMEIGMRATGVAGDLVAVAKKRDRRD